jgi:hypothetical protein
MHVAGETPYVSMGTAVTCALWQALGLQLPMSRRSQGARFFAGLKPLHPVGYAGLLRAFARTFVEAEYTPVRKDDRYDPVELIAAALEISIEQWDHSFGHEGFEASADFLAGWCDLALRVAALECLFRCRFPEPRWAAAVTGPGVGPSAALATDDILDSVRQFHGSARRDARKASECTTPHFDAILAETVVLGSSSPNAPRVFTDLDRLTRGRTCAGFAPRALPFACGMVLLGVRQLAEALAIFERIVEKVPGHTLALEQVAHCADLLGDSAKAHIYSKRASRLGRTTPRTGAPRSLVSSCQRSGPPTLAAMKSRG